MSKRTSYNITLICDVCGGEIKRNLPDREGYIDCPTRDVAIHESCYKTAAVERLLDVFRIQYTYYNSAGQTPSMGLIGVRKP